ncbi:MBG domain-containing protein [Raoultibacter timonensis]|uniref:MBG domain-containing protein n=1 Tax=Raoultibacter timonensis TaxID=1907662 RepID=UPI0015E1AA4B|nr:MBG domain-containing protein [Raoultibacter timonensis]
MKNSLEGKILAVFMSVVLVFTFTNFSAYAADGSAEGAAADSAQTEQADTREPSGEDAAVSEEQQNTTSEQPEASGDFSAVANQSEPETGEDESAADSDVATVKLDLQNAYLVFLDQTIAAPAKTFDVPAHKELDLQVYADESHEIASVKAVVDGKETIVEENGGGRYVLDAALVTSALTIAVETTEASSEGNAAGNAADPITSDTVIIAGNEGQVQGGQSEATESAEPVEVTADVNSPVFEGYAYVDDVVVKVTAGEGVLPEGTTVQASKVERTEVIEAVSETVENQGKVLQDAVAIDVTLLSKDGSVIQPEAPVNVCFFDANLEGDEVSVYRVSDDASQVEAIGARQADREVQSFDVDHFTIYVASGASYKATGIDLDSYSFEVGQTVKAKGNWNASWKAFSWKSSDERVAKVSSVSGHPDWANIVAVGEGVAEITYSYKYQSSAGWKVRTETAEITVVPASEKHTVTWYVNGKVSKQTTVSDGARPSYEGTPSRGIDSKYVTFAGWASAPNSKSYASADELPAVTEDTSYYASFTAKAYFYFVLEGKSNTSLIAKDYMYAGAGTILVPDDFKSGNRWYDGSNFSIYDYIVSTPSDAAIRQGIEKVYGADYQPEWEYSVDWTTLNIAKQSVGYNYNVIDSGASFHTDGAIQIDRETTAGVTYNVRYPDGKVVTNSTTHNKNAEFGLNSTVKLGETSFVTDGYEYDSHRIHEGASYKFDGWYTDQSYTTKAPDTVTLKSPTTYYARYLANTKTLTYDVNGGVFADGTTDSKSSVQQVGSRVTFIGEPTKEGKVFAGWLDEADGTLYPAGTSGMTMPDRNVTLVAQWTVYKAAITVWFHDTSENSKAYVVTDEGALSQERDLDKHALSIDSGNVRWYSASDIERFAEEAYELTPEVDRYEGYSVTVLRDGKWMEIEDLDAYVIQDNDDIRYHVAAEAAHEVTYTSGDHGSGEPFSGGQFYLGDEVTVKSFEDTGFDADAGYVFDHWKLVSDDESYGSDDLYTMGGSSVEFEAVYSADATQTYTVSYVSDGNGTVSVPANESIQVLGTEGVTGSTATAEPGYKFEGWYVDGVGIDGAEVVLTAETAAENIEKNSDGTYADTTFTARFVPDFDLKAIGFGVVYDGDVHRVRIDGTVLATDTVEYWIDDSKLESNAFVNVSDSAMVTVKVTRGDETWTSDPVSALIDPAPLSVTTVGKTRAYDGTPLTEAGNSVEGLVAGETLGVTNTGSITEVGSTPNTYELEWAGGENGYTAEESNYALGQPTLGTLAVKPAEAVINVASASKYYGDDDPTFVGTVSGLVGEDSLGNIAYSRINSEESVGSYENVLTAAVEEANPNYVYDVVNGDFAIEPAEGNIVRINADGLTKTYDGQPVSIAAEAEMPGSTLLYSTDKTSWSTNNPSFTDAGIYTVYAMATHGSYQDTAIVSAAIVVNPAPLEVAADDFSKVVGTDDPAFTYGFTGEVNGEVPGFTGGLARVAGEDVGTYPINQGTLALADNGAFKSANYALRFVGGVLDVTAATPIPLPTPTPTDTPTPAATPTPGVLPAGDPVAPVADTLQGIVEAVIGENETPLAQPSEERIDDEKTPLSTFDYVHCWVHYYLILGILLTLLYGAGVLVRRIRFAHKLKAYEDELLGVADEEAALSGAAPATAGAKGA